MTKKEYIQVFVFAAIVISVSVTINYSIKDKIWAKETKYDKYSGQQIYETLIQQDEVIESLYSIIQKQNSIITNLDYQNHQMQRMWNILISESTLRSNHESILTEIFPRIPE